MSCHSGNYVMAQKEDRQKLLSREQSDDRSWNNLEEFRRRTDPLKPNQPPLPVELRQPTLFEVHQVLAPKTDLRYESAAEIREQGQLGFTRLTNSLPMLYRVMNAPRDARGNF